MGKGTILHRACALHVATCTMHEYPSQHCIFPLFQIIVQYCACCARCCSRHRDDDADSKAQFIKEEGSYGAAAFGIPQKKRYHTCTRVMQILIAALALATTGVAAWGLAASIKDTDSQITDFWALVDSVDGKVNSTTTLLNNLSNQISTLQASVNTLNSQSSGKDLGK